MESPNGSKLPDEDRLPAGVKEELAKIRKNFGQLEAEAVNRAMLPRTPLDARQRRKEPGVKFICRLCGSKKYEAVRSDNGVCGPGFSSRIEHYVCGGCGVLFSDPKKFSAEPRSKKSKK